MCTKNLECSFVNFIINIKKLYVVEKSGINNYGTKGTNTPSLKMNDLNSRFHCDTVSVFNYITIIWVAQWSIVYTTCNKTPICTDFTFDSNKHLLSWMIL